MSEDTKRPSAAAVRKWARANGIKVGSQGLLSKALYDQYTAAQSAKSGNA